MSWRDATLKDLVFLQRGFDITKAQQKPGDVPVISSSGIKSHHSEAKVEGPGIVIGRKGTLGSVFFSEQDFWPHDTTLWSKELHGNSPRFVYYFLKTLRLENYNVGNANPTLNRNHIHDLEIRIPDRPTQDEIADILSAYDDLIENNRRRMALLEESARLLYREWFVHLRFPGHEHVPINDGVPEGWERKNYNDVFSFEGGFAFKSKSYLESGKYGVVTIKNVHDAKFVPDCPSRLDEVPEKMKEHCFLKTGDVLLSLTGNVGRACFVYGENYLLNQRVAKVSGTPGVPRSFVYWTFSNTASQQTLTNMAYGVAQLNLSPVKLGKCEFIKPSQMILDLFDESCESIFRQLIALSLQSRELESARDILLPRLMNGELAV